MNLEEVNLEEVNLEEANLEEVNLEEELQIVQLNFLLGPISAGLRLEAFGVLKYFPSLHTAPVILDLVI